MAGIGLKDLAGWVNTPEFKGVVSGLVTLVVTAAVRSFVAWVRGPGRGFAGEVQLILDHLADPVTAAESDSTGRFVKTPRVEVAFEGTYYVYPEGAGSGDLSGHLSGKENRAIRRAAKALQRRVVVMAEEEARAKVRVKMASVGKKNPPAADAPEGEQGRPFSKA